MNPERRRSTTKVDPTTADLFGHPADNPMSTLGKPSVNLLSTLPNKKNRATVRNHECSASKDPYVPAWGRKGPRAPVFWCPFPVFRSLHMQEQAIEFHWGGKKFHLRGIRPCWECAYFGLVLRCTWVSRPAAQQGHTRRYCALCGALHIAR